jgi:hypothetical protein
MSRTRLAAKVSLSDECDCAVLPMTRRQIGRLHANSRSDLIVPLDPYMKHHLLIAGTGRAGTSFLVQYLTACGLDTHLSRYPDAKLDEHANAGLEDLPLPEIDQPYVLKSPWLFEYVERLLAREDIRIDAVVISIRDIVEAATSRVTLSLRERFGDTSLPEELTLWETWATTPGGVVYSLNPLDQARLLAMGFHQLIHALVREDVPIVFLDFPRFVKDGEYLFERLRPVIGSSVTRETALDAHRKTARPELVRTGNELSGVSSTETDTVARFSSRETVDRAALFRELRRAQMAEQAAVRKTDDASHEASEARRLATEASQMVGERDRQLADAVAALDQSGRKLSLAETQLVALQAEQLEWQKKVQDLESRLRISSETLGEVLSSNSWKMTWPIRSVLGSLRRSRMRGNG